jgi:twinkle protein
MEREDWKFAAFSPEATPARFTKQLIEQYTGKSFDVIPQKWQHVEGLERMSLPELYEAQEWLSTRYAMIDPPSLANATIENMLEIARQKIEYDGVQGIVFDPWSWIAKRPGTKQMLTNYISDQLAIINHFCVQYNVHLWLIAHPTKLRKQESGDYDGHYAPPDLYDIADSAHFFNFAYMGLTVWRNLKTHSPETEIHITKAKFEENGQMGKVVLMYDKYTKRYYDAGTEPERTYARY